MTFHCSDVNSARITSARKLEVDYTFTVAFINQITTVITIIYYITAILQVTPEQLFKL